MLEAKQSEDGLHTRRWPSPGCQRPSRCGTCLRGGAAQCKEVKSNQQERGLEGQLAWRVRPKPGKKGKGHGEKTPMPKPAGLRALGDLRW